MNAAETLRGVADRLMFRRDRRRGNSMVRVLAVAPLAVPMILLAALLEKKDKKAK